SRQRLVGGVELDGGERTHARADLGDHVQFGEGSQGGRDLRFQLGGPLDHSLVLEDVHDGQPGGTGGGVSRVGVAVTEDVARLVEERGGDPRRHDHASQWQIAACHAFGEGDYVRLEVEAGGGEPVTHPAEAGDHLVRYVQAACLADRVTDPMQIALRHRAPAAGADHRLDEDAGDPLGSGVLDGLLDGLGVVVGDNHHVSYQIAVAGPVDLDAREGGAVGVHAVVAPLPGDEDGPLRLADGGEVAAGQLGGGVDGVGAPLAEEHLRAGIGRDGGDALGQLEGGTRPEVDEAMEGGELLHLPVHRLDHLAAAVADVGVPEPGGGVEIAVAYLVVHVHPFGPVHDEGGVLDGVHVREGVP